MRIARLELLRYGKFTDKIISLPNAAKDFHLIIGPNEAGKSTLRESILELLFGIKTQSRFNFLHPHSEMRLGALIEQGETSLEFIRTKARTKTLQTPSGVPLPDNALVSFLGQIDRAFFDQMFGLDHERLVSGGREILSASNDIGQILFQAAAGIGSLGDIRDRLEAEANTLWAKRKSSDREYYIACDEFEKAEIALKQTTVRTKEWQESRNLVDRIGEELKLARESYQALEQERIQLERVRRVAPILTTIKELERQLTELGAVVSLPEGAAGQLANSEHEIAIATKTLEVFESQLSELQKRIEPIHPVETILARSADIEALSELRQQLRNHEIDISKREGEIRSLWQAVDEMARQLGWTEVKEESVVRNIPGSIVRSTLSNLIRRYEPLTQTLASANDSLKTREDEIKDINAEIDTLLSTEIPVTLISALAIARSLGDVAAQEKRFESQIGRLNRELESTALELGKWNIGTDNLRKLLPPTQDETNALIKNRNELESNASTLNERIDETQSEIQTLQMEMAQYKTAHHPVTLADVHQVRNNRDSIWQTIKSGAVAVSDAAHDYETEVASADVLSDNRHDKAQEEIELQSQMDRLERLQQQLTDLESRLQKNALSLTSIDQGWEARSKEVGLDGMLLLQANDWRSSRERVLSIASQMIEVQSSQNEFLKSVGTAKDALMDAILPFKPEAKTLDLSALIMLADKVIDTATRAQERRDTLSTQKIRADASTPELNNRVVQAQAAIDTWQTELLHNLELAHLPQAANIGAIEEALELFDRMNQNLQKINDIRANRIDMMRRDLKGFSDTAHALANDLLPEIAKESASQIALTLASSLSLESAASKDLIRLQAEFEKVTLLATAASNRVAEANASLEPLLRQSATLNNDELRTAIERSDLLRSLTSDINQAVKQLLQAGEGLDREALKSEFDLIDANSASIRLTEIKLVLGEVVTQQNKLSGELNSAEAALAKIAGQDEAARAESQRQEALARMANAVERYIKVYTAAKLLRWSIERFQEAKQGPMLSRASEVFFGLTQGAFNKLVVDYESDPLKLSGRRTNGEIVDIEGMSEGTRDQLYLALRLAALELHLEQTVPLPFIADDLFINYDDGRAKAGLEALAKLSEMTQVIFLSHHDHLVPLAQSVFGDRLNLVSLGD